MSGEWPALWVLVGSLLALGLLQVLTQGISTYLGGMSRSGTEHGRSRWRGGRRSPGPPSSSAHGPSSFSGHPDMLGDLWHYFYGETSRR